MDFQVTLVLHPDTPGHLFTTPGHTSELCFTTDRSFENTVYYTVVKLVCPEKNLRWPEETENSRGFWAGGRAKGYFSMGANRLEKIDVDPSGYVDRFQPI